LGEEDEEEEEGEPTEHEHDDEPSADDSDDSDVKRKKNKKQKFKKRVIEQDEVLIKREATLLELIKKLGMNKVIIFCNEKKECERMLTLFLIYGLRAA
jgi:ATP-dependent RNA helicase DDX27